MGAYLAMNLFQNTEHIIENEEDAHWYSLSN
jgi:hypothetical protein